MNRTAPSPGASSAPATRARTRWRRIVLAGGLAALLPKCLACVAGYLALGAGLVGTAPELCGTAADEVMSPAWRLGAVAGVLIVGAGWLRRRSGARPSAVAKTMADRLDALFVQRSRPTSTLTAASS